MWCPKFQLGYSFNPYFLVLPHRGYLCNVTLFTLHSRETIHHFLEILLPKIKNLKIKHATFHHQTHSFANTEAEMSDGVSKRIAPSHKHKTQPDQCLILIKMKDLNVVPYLF